MIRLTERRLRILEAIAAHTAAHGAGLSVREIGSAVGLASSSSVAFQLAHLERGGLLVRSGRAWSTAELTGPAVRRLAASR
ncbi:LexA family protein [Streptomyces sp. NPDC054961]